MAARGSSPYTISPLNTVERQRAVRAQRQAWEATPRGRERVALAERENNEYLRRHAEPIAPPVLAHHVEIAPIQQQARRPGRGGHQLLILPLDRRGGIPGDDHHLPLIHAGRIPRQHDEVGQPLAVAPRGGAHRTEIPPRYVPPTDPLPPAYQTRPADPPVASPVLPPAFNPHPPGYIPGPGTRFNARPVVTGPSPDGQPLPSAPPALPPAAAVAAYPVPTTASAPPSYPGEPFRVEAWSEDPSAPPTVSAPPGYATAIGESPPQAAARAPRQPLLSRLFGKKPQ